MRARSDVNYYLMFNDYAGACIVFVEKIMPPDETTRNERDKWSETMSFRRVFCTEEAASAMHSKGKTSRGKCMGNAFFLKKLHEEEGIGEKNGEPFTTYHVGDAYYTGDIRTLVGVVRWKSVDAENLAEDYFPEYLQADLVSTGLGVVQNTAVNKR